MLSATIIDGDIQARAQARVAVLVGILVGQKNIRPHVPDCEDIAKTIVEILTIGETFTVAEGVPSEALDAQLRWYVNNLLDLGVAYDLVAAICSGTGYKELDGDTRDRFVGRILDAAKGESLIGGPLVVWAMPDQVTELARSWKSPPAAEMPDALDEYIQQLITAGSLFMHVDSPTPSPERASPVCLSEQSGSCESDVRGP